MFNDIECFDHQVFPNTYVHIVDYVSLVILFFFFLPLASCSYALLRAQERCFNINVQGSTFFFFSLLRTQTEVVKEHFN